MFFFREILNNNKNFNNFRRTILVKRTSLFALVLVIMVSFFASDGFSFMLGGKEMVKNGTGNRTKFLFGTLYVATLYVPADLKGKSAKDIIESNEPMSMVLVIESNLITRDRFLEATSEGFNKAASSGYPSAHKQTYLDQFKKVELKKGDVLTMNYGGGAVVTMLKASKSNKTQTLGTIAGLEFKKALYAIWLGPNPVQDSLKNGLLSGK
jgi:hypothetical protein